MSNHYFRDEQFHAYRERKIQSVRTDIMAIPEDRFRRMSDEEVMQQCCYPLIPKALSFASEPQVDEVREVVLDGVFKAKFSFRVMFSGSAELLYIQPSTYGTHAPMKTEIINASELVYSYVDTPSLAAELKNSVVGLVAQFKQYAEWQRAGIATLEAEMKRIGGGVIAERRKNLGGIDNINL